MARSDHMRVFTRELVRLARLYRREVNRCIAQHGLSDARAVPVLHIARAGHCLRQGELAEELGIEGPSLVRLLDQIGAAGLIERREDPSDGRAKTLHLTPTGKDLALVLEQVLTRLRKELLVDVSDDDLAATVRTFTALEAALERHADKAPGA